MAPTCTRSEIRLRRLPFTHLPRDVRGVDRAITDLEQLTQDLTGRRTGDRTAVPALLDDHDDGVARLGGRRVAREQCEVVLALDLRGAGLAGHRDRETPERAGPRAARGHAHERAAQGG